MEDVGHRWGKDKDMDNGWQQMEEWESWRILIEFIMKRNRILALGGFIRVIHSGGTRPLPSQPFYSSSSHHQPSLDNEVCVAHAIEFVSIIY